MSDLNKSEKDCFTEMKARALKVIVTMQACDIEDCLLCEEQADELAAFAAKEVARAVEEEREKNCKTICWLCADEKWLPAVRHGLNWLHYPVNPVYEGDGAVRLNCNAWAIHERSQVKGEGL
jgi:hypothetical protein